MKIRRIKDLQEPSYKKNKKREKLRKMLIAVKYILVTALFVTTAVYAAMSPFFNITKIVVNGGSHYDNQTVISASGVYEGLNGFKLLFNNPGKFYFLRIGSAERAIMESCPYIKSTKVRFIIPAKISIELKERVASANLIVPGKRLIIDREAYLLEIVSSNNTTGDSTNKENVLPVIKGIKIDEYIPGKKINIQQNSILSAFKVFDTIKEIDSRSTEKLLPGLDYIDVEDINNIKFSLQSRVIVNIGETDDLNYKINTVQTIFTKNIKKDQRGKLDFYNNGNPVFTPENGG